MVTPSATLWFVLPPSPPGPRPTYIPLMPARSCSAVVRTAIALASVGAVVLVSGCVKVADTAGDLRLGGRVGLEAFAPVDPAGRVLAFPPREDATLNGLSRENWPTTWVLVPASEVVHQQTFVTELAPLTQSPAQRGEYPTLSNSGQYVSSRASKIDQAEQGVVAPFVAIADAAMIVPRVVAQAVMPPHTTPTTPIRPLVNRVRRPGEKPGIQPLLETPFPMPLESAALTPPPGGGVGVGQGIGSLALPPSAAAPVLTERAAPLPPVPQPVQPAPAVEAPPVPAAPPATTPSGAPLPPGVTPAKPGTEAAPGEGGSDS